MSWPLSVIVVILMEEILPKLEELRKIVDKKATSNRDVRDELNEKMRGFIGTRNSYNSQVRELISEVQRQKVIRDDANAAVRTAKNERAEKNQLVRDAKDVIRELSPESTQEQGRNDRRGRRNKEDTPASLRRKIQILENEFEMGKHVGSNEDKAMDRLKRMKRKLRVIMIANKLPLILTYQQRELKNISIQGLAEQRKLSSLKTSRLD